MDSRSPTKGLERRAPRNGGFTLLEILLAAFISAFVFAGVLSAYSFMGRSLIRLGNAQQIEAGSHEALFYFTKDVSAAKSITTATTSDLLMTVPSGTVEYVYNSGTGTLTRSVNSGTATTLVKGITSFSFEYYDASQAATTTAAVVKMADFKLTSGNGVGTSGSLSDYAVASPRVLMRNTPML